jgi:hypothetical protein
MSLFEWFGESHNPGPVGGVDFGRPETPPRSRTAVLVSATFAAAFLAVPYVLFAVYGKDISLAAWAGIVGLTLVYLLAGYFIRPAPDYSNVGWLGGMMDHPFRYSDDINRSLLALLFVLWPGRFVAESSVDFVVLLRNAGGPTEKRKRKRKRADAE